MTPRCTIVAARDRHNARSRRAAIQFQLSEGFWPSNLPLFHVSAGVILTHVVGVKMTHLGEYGGILAADPGKSRFITAADLMLQLATARKQERLREYFNRAVVGPRLLIIDEIGYLPFGREEANLLFNVVAKRYERGSIIVTSNLAFAQWSSAFADDKTLTAALLDQIYSDDSDGKWVRFQPTLTVPR
jgi:hypothetical protein